MTLNKLSAIIINTQVKEKGIMTITEYEQIKGLKYREYCDYLQKKYGIGLSDYMTKAWNKNRKCTRTNEGLIAHHKYEDCAIMLSTPEYARNNPFEWQLATNIVYCDYLEHLLLHILICENPSANKNKNEEVGIGGVINFLVPELNDVYSGWETMQEWRRNCHNLIKNDKNVYLTLLKRFKQSCKNNYFYTEDCLYKSFNDEYGGWKVEQNMELFKEIEKL